MTTENRAGEHGRVSGAGDAIRAEFDWTETLPSTAVVEVVARAADCNPTATEPLFGALDPDALDALLRSTDDHVTVEFAFAGHEVTVAGDGSVVARASPAVR